VTHHRAFDRVADPEASLETLIDLGLDRVLTSGGADTAWQGRGVLRRLVTIADGRIGILAGGRVRGDHVRALVERTGVREVHARLEGIEGIRAALAHAPC
jgi:copper homeostasis protein